MAIDRAIDVRNQQTSFGGPLGKDHFLAIRVELERLRPSLIGIVVGSNCFDTLAYTPRTQYRPHIS